MVTGTDLSWRQGPTYYGGVSSQCNFKSAQYVSYVSGKLRCGSCLATATVEADIETGLMQCSCLTTDVFNAVQLSDNRRL
jgi:hypothetical protein